MSSATKLTDPPLSSRDPEIARLIQEEEVRETVKLRLIPSENYVSRAVLEASGSVLTRLNETRLGGNDAVQPDDGDHRQRKSRGTVRILRTPPPKRGSVERSEREQTARVCPSA